MVQIKVTPEMLEEVAKRASDTKYVLESIHKDLCNQIDYLCYQWIGASNQNFVQMFNDARPKAFTSINAIANVEEELKRIAEKFRTADASYDGSIVNGNLSDDNVEEESIDGGVSEKSILEKIWDGIYVGSGQFVGGVVEGFKSLDDTVTKENIKYAIGHPLETASTAWNTFSDSFMNDVWHGDAESRTRWGTNIFMELGLGGVGGKGISKVTTLEKGASVAKFSEGISHFTNNLPLKDRFAFAGASGFGSTQIKTFEALQEARDTFMFSKTGGR
ncbi:WXG100 family type VII secretion target, partial [Bacillus paramycoides]